MKRHIKTIYPRDRAAFSTLARVGYVDDGQLHLFLRDKRIDGYLKDGLLERNRISTPGRMDRDRICYKLTDKGRDLCRRVCGMEHIYHAQSAVHDLRLAEQYFSLPAEEQVTWRSEAEVHVMLEERIMEIERQNAAVGAELREDWNAGRLSVPDAIYCRGESAVAFEVVTRNYGVEEIQAKQDAAALLNASYEEARA